MIDLKGKRALVTAGAQGIGLAISRELAAGGCDVFVHYRTSREAAVASAVSASSRSAPTMLSLTRAS